MQQPWTLPVKEFALHALVCSISLIVFAIELMCGSVITSMVSHVVTSKFPLRVLTALEYTVVVGNALYMTLVMGRDVVRKLRSLTQ